jgi:hypothetical protein
MTTLTDRLRHHALLHQQCTVQDEEQRMFADDLLTAAAEIDGLREVVESAAAADEIERLRAERDALKRMVRGVYQTMKEQP